MTDTLKLTDADRKDLAEYARLSSPHLAHTRVIVAYLQLEQAVIRFLTANEVSRTLNDDRDDVANMVEWDAALTALEHAVEPS